MKLAVMQPYLFPYIGYFQLMKAVDQWVVFDEIQFIDKGWINRNRILHPNPSKVWQYITVPLKSRGQFDRICDIEIDNTQRWREQFLGKLTSYRRKAPYYQRTISLVNECLELNENNLSKFLNHTLRKTAEHLGLTPKITSQSEVALSPREVAHPGQWALKIATQLKATEYINPAGGVNLFNQDEFEAENIRLRFIRSRLEPYKQRREGFVSGLSIIDVMMWNSNDEIAKMLSFNFDLLTQVELLRDKS